MFRNIGGKIKVLSKVLFWIEAAAGIIVGIGLIPQLEIIAVLIAFGIILAALIISWFFYGFGEVIDKLTEIERNTRKERNIGAWEGQIKGQDNETNRSPNKIEAYYSHRMKAKEKENDR